MIHENHSMIERQAVRSTDIAIIGYDAENQLLEVAFKSGNVYHFREVPVSIHREFLAAPSAGTYFRDHIRDRYSSQKIR